MGRRLLATILIGVFLISLSAGGSAKRVKRTERTATSSYSGPSLGTAAVGGGCPAITNSCAPIAIDPKEKYVTVTVSDMTGTAVAFRLEQDLDPSTLESDETYGVFCGTTGDAPIRLRVRGGELLTYVWASGDVVCPGAFGTSGVVTATLSNLP